MRRSFVCASLVIGAALVGTMLGAERKYAVLVEQGVALSAPAEPAGTLVMSGVDLGTALEGLREVSPLRERATSSSQGLIPTGVAQRREAVTPAGQFRFFRVLPEGVMQSDELAPQVQITPMAPGTRTMVRVLVRIPSPAALPSDAVEPTAD